MLISSKSTIEIVPLKIQHGKEFETKDLGVVKKILGMKIIREISKWKLFLSKKGYIERVLKGLG